MLMIRSIIIAKIKMNSPFLIIYFTFCLPGVRKKHSQRLFLKNPSFHLHGMWLRKVLITLWSIILLHLNFFSLFFYRKHFPSPQRIVHATIKYYSKTVTAFSTIAFAQGTLEEGKFISTLAIQYCSEEKASLAFSHTDQILSLRIMCSLQQRFP